MKTKFWSAIVLSVSATCSGMESAVSSEEATTTWIPPSELVAAASKNNPGFNYDEGKVPEYTLPDPLVAADGSAVTKATWPARRAEIIEMFREHVYGRTPVGRPQNLSFTVLEEDSNEFNGRATRNLIEISFDTPHAGRYRFRTQLYLPNDVAKPVPTFVLLQFQGLTDRATPQVIDRGFGLAILDRTQIAADDDSTYRNGVINAFSGDGELPPDAWRAIAAWAWAGSRVLDYLETDPAVDHDRVGVIGFSRMGKTACWSGASDERFAIIHSQESGCGGAALSRRAFGETVRRINTKFPHWFCENFQRYNGAEASLPVDQHMLIALAAPRPIYVTSAEGDLWSDPRGEFLSCLHADPVYRLLGVDGLGINRMPPLETPVVDGRIGYHIRQGPHNFADYDWQRFMDFAARHLR